MTPPHLSGSVWFCLDLSGSVWLCLVLSRPVWLSLVLSRPVWLCLGLSGSKIRSLGMVKLNIEGSCPPRIHTCHASVCIRLYMKSIRLLTTLLKSTDLSSSFSPLLVFTCSYISYQCMYTFRHEVDSVVHIRAEISIIHCS